MKQGCLYILTNKKNGTLYVGCTSNLSQRITQHKEKSMDGFTKRYDIVHLVWYEIYEDIESAILQEKRIKKWKRIWKLELIEKLNPERRDLSYDL